MRNLKTLLSILLLIFSINTISAQYGNGGYGGGYGNQGGYGNNRMSQMSHNIPQNDKPEEESEKSKKERLEKIVEKLKTELILDELQVYAVRTVVEESMKKQAVLFKKEKSQDEKIADFQALSESTDRKILEFLNKDQKIKYTAMNADRKEKLQELSDKHNR